MKTPQEILKQYSGYDEEAYFTISQDGAIKAMEEYASQFMKIKDMDIATVEALHDLLLDKHCYNTDFPTLKKARELTNKMYNVIYPKKL